MSQLGKAQQKKGADYALLGKEELAQQLPPGTWQKAALPGRQQCGQVRAGEMAQLVKHLPYQHQDLCKRWTQQLCISNPSSGETDTDCLKKKKKGRQTSKMAYLFKVVLAAAKTD